MGFVSGIRSLFHKTPENIKSFNSEIDGFKKSSKTFQSKHAKGLLNDGGVKKCWMR